MKPFQQTYDILSVLGQGGMGSVYLAKHKRLGTLWAVKEVKKTLSDNTSLFAEANILKRLNHPLLPRIIDIFEDSESIYIVEDYIEGVSMDRKLAEIGKFGENQIRAWAEQLCNALDYLHSQKPNPIIYRDLKPSNIMITPTGGIILIDFGIAREYKEDGGMDTTNMGTRGYAAPEQLGACKTDVRTDIYSLGVTLYHGITGKSPNEPPYELRPIRQWDENLSEGMEYIIEKCTKSDPSERYQSVKELELDIQDIDKFSSITRKKKKIYYLRIAACCLLIFVGAALILYGANIDQTNARIKYESKLEKGKEYIENGDLDSAAELLTEADAEYGIGDGHRALIASYMDAGYYIQCSAMAQQTVATYPKLANDAEINFCWGIALDGEGNVAEALEKFKTASRVAPDNIIYLRYLASTYQKLGYNDEASAIYEKIKAQASDALTAFVYAGILDAQGDYLSAADQYNKCISSSLDDEIRIAAYRELTSMLRNNRANESSFLEKEIDTLIEMQNEYPYREQAFILERLGEAYYLRGTQNDDNKDLAKADECFTDLLAMGYGRASTYINIAIIKQNMADFENAELTLLQMMDRYPQNGDACVQMGFLIADRESSKPQNQRDYRDVEKYYEKAVELGAAGTGVQRLDGIIKDLRTAGWIR